MGWKVEDRSGVEDREFSVGGLVPVRCTPRRLSRKIRLDISPKITAAQNGTQGTFRQNQDIWPLSRGKKGHRIAPKR